ncbi:MAG TPA: integrase family protein [Rhizomicrobium sp.]|nr:integrase family protein [Rhizomicrobium sp.]
MTIRSLKAPAKGAVVFNDDLIPGFGVRVSEGGTMSYVLTHGPRRTRETLGRVGVVKLAAAREEAKVRLAQYTLGRDKPRAVTWDKAKEEYLADKASELKPRTHADYTYILGRHFKYGPTKLLEISPHDLMASLARSKHTPGEQQHAYVILRAFMRWAHRKHYLDRNPMERMQEPRSYVPRARILTNDELGRVWQASEDDTFGKIVIRWELARLQGVEKVSEPSI